MVTGIECGVAVDLGLLHAELVVAVGRLAVVEVEGPENAEA